MDTTVENLGDLPEAPSVELDETPVIASVWVKPTARWLGKSQRIPRGRKISRNGLYDPIEVTQDEANYLTKNFFAVVVTEAVAEAVVEVSADPVASENDQSGSPSGEPDPPEFNLETLCLEYLNQHSAEEIARDIKGIGRKTADELVEARPLDWEAVQVILSDRQIDAIKAFIGSGTVIKPGQDA